MESACAIIGRARSHICVQLDVKSQLIIVHLRRLQQTTNLHSPFTLLFLRSLCSLFTLLGKQLSIVAGELLQGDQEVAQNDLETVQVGVGRKQSIDEGCNLGTGFD